MRLREPIRLSRDKPSFASGPWAPCAVSHDHKALTAFYRDRFDCTRFGQPSEQTHFRSAKDVAVVVVACCSTASPATFPGLLLPFFGVRGQSNSQVRIDCWYTQPTYCTLMCVQAMSHH